MKSPAARHCSPSTTAPSSSIAAWNRAQTALKTSPFPCGPSAALRPRHARPHRPFRQPAAALQARLPRPHLRHGGDLQPSADHAARQRPHTGLGRGVEGRARPSGAGGPPWSRSTTLRTPRARSPFCAPAAMASACPCSKAWRYALRTSATCSAPRPSNCGCARAMRSARWSSAATWAIRTSPFCANPQRVESADVLIIESTYGDRLHEKVRPRLPPRPRRSAAAHVRPAAATSSSPLSPSAARRRCSTFCARSSWKTSSMATAISPSMSTAPRQRGHGGLFAS